MKHAQTFLALAAFALSAQAVEYPRDEIILHGASEHFKSRNKTKVRQQATPGTPAVIDRVGWNETNYGIGWRHAWSQDWSLQSGIYKDSLARASAYVTGDYTPLGTEWLRVGGFAAMRVTNDGFGPAAGGLARLQFERWSLAARVWPTVGRYSGGVAVEAGFRFN